MIFCMKMSLLFFIFMVTTVTGAFAQPTITGMALSTFSPTNNNTLQWRITFSEPVTGVSTANFSTTATTTGANPVVATLDSVTSAPGGQTWIITTIGVSGDGTLGLNFTSALGISGASGPLLTPSFIGPFYVVDNTQPQVLSITRLDASPTSATTVNFEITFSEPVYSLSEINFSPGGSLTGTDGGVSPTSDPYVWVAAISGISGSGTIQLDLTDTSGVTDEAGNSLLSGYTAGEVYTIDQQGPQLVCITRLDSSPTSATSVRFLVEFDQPTVNVLPTNFTVNAAGTSGTITTVTPASPSNTFTLTVDSISGQGTLTVDLTNPAGITDEYGNPMISSGPGCEFYQIDRVAPEVVSIALAEDSPTSATTLNFIVTFSEPVTSGTLSDFTLTGNGVTGTISGVTTINNITTVTVTGVSGPGSVCLQVNSPSTITDLTGNPLTGIPVTSPCYIVCLDAGTITAYVPPDGATVPSSTSAISWTPSTPGLTFHVYFDGAFLETTTATTSAIPQPLLPGQHSYLIDIDGACTSGTQIIFHVLDAPVLVFPGDQFAACKTPRAFSWEPVEGATTYTLVVDGVDRGITTGPDIMLTLPSFSLPPGTYQWYVNAESETGGLAQSDVRSFDVLGTDSVTPSLFNTNGTIHDMFILGDTIYIAGDFTQVEDADGTFVTRNNVASLSRTTFALKPWAPNVNGTVYTLESYPTGLLLGGDFTRINDIQIARIASIDYGTTVPGDFRPGANGPVRAIELVGNTVYYGGDFTKVGEQIYNFGTPGIDAVRMAIADLTTTNVISADVDPNATVRDLLFDNGDLYVAGVFSEIASKPYHGLARFELETTSILKISEDFIDSPTQLPVDLYVYTMHKMDNILYIGGSFNNVLGADRRNAAALRLGDVNSSTSITLWDPRPNSAIHAIASNGNENAVYIGGDFTSLDNMLSTYLVAVDPLVGYPLSCSFDADRAIYAIEVTKDFVGVQEYLYAGGLATEAGP